MASALTLGAITKAARSAGFKEVCRADLALGEVTVTWPNANLDAFLDFTHKTLGCSVLYISKIYVDDPVTYLPVPQVLAVVFAGGVPHVFESTHPSEEELDAAMAAQAKEDEERAIAQPLAEKLFAQAEASGSLGVLFSDRIFLAQRRSIEWFETIERFVATELSVDDANPNVASVLIDLIVANATRFINERREELINRCYRDPGPIAEQITERDPDYWTYLVDARTKIAADWLFETYGLRDKAAAKEVARAKPTG